MTSEEGQSTFEKNKSLFRLRDKKFRLKIEGNFYWMKKKEEERKEKKRKKYLELAEE